jgi:hypothetical protein
MARASPGSPIGEALTWAARIMAIGLMMFLPGVAGTWLDGRLGTGVFGPVGFVIGVSLSIYRLVQFSRTPERR